MYRPLAYKDTWGVVPMLLRPKSRGAVKLKTSNPFEKPAVYAGYFSHPEDIKVLVEAVKFVLAMAETESFQVQRLANSALSFDSSGLIFRGLALAFGTVFPCPVASTRNCGLMSIGNVCADISPPPSTTTQEITIQNLAKLY